MTKSLAQDQTDVWHKYVHRVKGIDFLIGYAVACSSSQARVQDFLSGKLQVCKVLIGGSNFFEVVHLLFSMETYKNWMWFSRGWRSGPSAFIRIRTCFFFKTFFTYLRIFHSVLNHLTRLYKVRTWPITWYLETRVRQSYKYDVFSETHFLVLTKNLRCFDEFDVRTSQKTTYAQFKIYRTNFIDEIGPRSAGICRSIKPDRVGC